MYIAMYVGKTARDEVVNCLSMQTSTTTFHLKLNTGILVTT